MLVVKGSHKPGGLSSMKGFSSNDGQSGGLSAACATAVTRPLKFIGAEHIQTHCGDFCVHSIYHCGLEFVFYP